MREYSVMIREKRLRAGLSQSKLAEILDCSSSTIYRWEKGESKPTCDNIQKINDWFDEN